MALLLAEHERESRYIRFGRRCALALATVLGCLLVTSLPGQLWHNFPRYFDGQGGRQLRGSPSQSRSKHAFVSLLWGNRADGLLDFLVLAHSLRRAGATSDIVALLPQGDRSMDLKQILEAHGARTAVVPQIPLPKSMVNQETSTKWLWVFTKFVAFNLTEYEKVALLDTDMVQRQDVNPESVFAECDGVELCMALDVTPTLFREDYNNSQMLVNMSNAGLMVLTPSAQRFSRLTHAIKHEQHKYHLPEQQFISYYVLQPENEMSFKYLSNRWNQCAECSGSSTALAHFMGEHKPRQYQLCVGKNMSLCNQSLPDWHRTWQRRLLEVEPCSATDEEDKCQMQSRCKWCGHYCMEEDIPCSSTLFREPVATLASYLTPNTSTTQSVTSPYQHSH